MAVLLAATGPKGAVAQLMVSAVKPLLIVELVARVDPALALRLFQLLDPPLHLQILIRVLLKSFPLARLTSKLVFPQCTQGYSPMAGLSS